MPDGIHTLKTPTRNPVTPVGQTDISRDPAEVLDEIDGVVYELDAETRTFTYVSKYAEKLLGFSQTEWLEPGFFDRQVHQYDRAAVIAAIRAAAAAHEDISADYRIVGSRGETVWVRQSTRLRARGRRGNPIVGGMLLDVSSLKFAELALRESEERYTQLAEASTECIIHHENGRIIDVNPVCGKLLGYSRDEMIGLLGTDLTAPEDRKRLALHIQSGSETPLAGHAMRKDGTRIPVEVLGRDIHLGGKHARVAVLRDISDRRRMEEEIRLRELDYKTLLEEASDAIVLTSQDFRIIAINQRACEMAKMCEEEAIGRPISDFLIAEDLRLNPLRILDLLPGESLTAERPLVSGDGSRVLTEISAKKLGDGRVLAIIRDITERRKTEEALKQARALVATAFETSRDAVVLFRLSDDAVLDVNSAWVQLTGIPKEEIVGRSQFDFGVWADPSAREKYREKLKREGIVRDLEFTVRARNGELRRVLISAEVVQLGGEPTVLAVGHDVTDQRRLENELVQSQNLEAIGRFAGSIAHDFNNILTGILTFSELATASLTEDDSAYSDVDQIRKAARRAAALTKQLLTFSRHQVQHRRTLSVNDVISEIEPMLRSLLGERCGLAVVLAPHLANVRADVCQIEQVLVNLVVNARDAIRESGQITIETCNSTMPSAGSATLDSRAAVSIIVSDNGTGIPPEIRDRIFEPFFTTKAGSGGTGLGLSTVYGIVKQSDGSIQLESTPGKGTCFRVFLPATLEAKEPGAASTPKAGIPSARGRILVIDDETVVRLVVKRILGKHGYEVAEAKSGEDALRLIRDRKLKPDLVLTDLAMPGMNGRELARKLNGEFAGIQVVYMSGYPEEVDEDGAGAAPVAFLQKPFDSAQLLEAVGTALAGRRAG